MDFKSCILIFTHHWATFNIYVWYKLVYTVGVYIKYKPRHKKGLISLHIDAQIRSS